ncbi:TetR/AcrR family transcriptional regulator [Glutamicibacter endophyticus]|uniref:TetR/AcrR family transcriptional regulator n=1 Tax=Glutamicibacter endophyticus TaxID=1522174 RepID=UPI003AF15043
MSKSQQRKRDLLSAATHVIGAHGISGANIRAVAEQAGISTGSVLYHFESFDKLVIEAVKNVLDEFSTRRRQLIDGIADPRERLRRMITSGIPEVISDDLRVIYEVAAVLRDKPEYRASMTLLAERQVGLYQVVIEVGVALGAFRPRGDVEGIATNLVALEDGYGLYLLDPDNWQRERYLANLIQYAQIALDCDLSATDETPSETDEEPQ